MIQIKSYFFGWKTVDKQTATRWVNQIWCGMTAIPENRKAEHINKNRLRGITVQELLSDETQK